MYHYGSIPNNTDQNNKAQKNSYNMIVIFRVIEKGSIKPYIGDETIKKGKEMIVVE